MCLAALQPYIKAAEKPPAYKYTTVIIMKLKYDHYGGTNNEGISYQLRQFITEISGT